MPVKLRILLCLLLIIILAGCSLKSGSDSSTKSYFGHVSKADFDTLANDYRQAQDQIEELRKNLQEMEKEKTKSDETNKTLRQTIQKKDIIISLQGKVIKLLDDPNQTLQKSIEQQLAEQDIDAKALYLDTF